MFCASCDEVINYNVNADVLDVIQCWHDENHGIGGMALCHERPCRDVTRARS